MVITDKIKREADRVFRQRVLRARATSPEEKLAAGPRLFEYASKITLGGIRNQHPDAEEAEVRRIFSERLLLQTRIEAEQRKQYLRKRDGGGASILAPAGGSSYNPVPSGAGARRHLNC